MARVAAFCLILSAAPVRAGGACSPCQRAQRTPRASGDALPAPGACSLLATAAARRARVGTRWRSAVATGGSVSGAPARLAERLARERLAREQRRALGQLRCAR
jgi:hypothetical protein